MNLLFQELHRWIRSEPSIPHSVAGALYLGDQSAKILHRWELISEFESWIAELERMNTDAARQLIKQLGQS